MPSSTQLNAPAASHISAANSRNTTRMSSTGSVRASSSTMWVTCSQSRETAHIPISIRPKPVIT